MIKILVFDKENKFIGKGLLLDFCVIFLMEDKIITLQKEKFTENFTALEDKDNKLCL